MGWHARMDACAPDDWSARNTLRHIDEPDVHITYNAHSRRRRSSSNDGENDEMDAMVIYVYFGRFPSRAVALLDLEQYSVFRTAILDHT